MADIKLSKRLAAIARLAPPGGGAADVGTDHGIIPVFLCQRGKNAPIYAADINPDPLRHAAETAAEHGVSDKISLVLCDGLAALSGEDISCVIIAGMGGETVISILQAALWTRLPGKTLVLQPMTKAPELRRWLYENGYRVVSEELVEDGKLYELFSVTGGQDEPYSMAELYTGHTALIAGHELYSARLNELADKARRALEGLSHSQAADESRKAELRRLISGFEELERNIGRTT